MSPFWQGFWSVFGLGPRQERVPFTETLDKKTPEEALRGDYEKVIGDMDVAYARWKSPTIKTGAQIAYEAYFKSCGGKSLISGAPLPTWDAQSVEIRLAWSKVATAVINDWESEDFNGDTK